MKESKIFNQDCLKTMSAIGKEKADLMNEVMEKWVKEQKEQSLEIPF